MDKKYYTLKDFELSFNEDVIERANGFQKYINQLNDFGCKSISDFTLTAMCSRLLLSLKSQHRY